MKQKFLRFLNSAVDLVLETADIAVYVLCGYVLSLLVEHTIGEKWPELSAIIRNGSLIAVTALGALQFVAPRAARIYRKVIKELKDKSDENS